MRPFATYIEYLLMTRHYCYVPGRGAYMMADEGAKMDAVPGIGAQSRRVDCLSAPRRSVLFSPLHQHDDGMLANLLMEAEGMTYDEACRYIERQAPLLPDHFEEAASLHTDTDNFGFDSLQLETWTDLEARLNAETATPELPVVTPKADIVAIPKYWIKRAAVAVLIVLIFFTNFIGLNRGDMQLASMMHVANISVPTIVAADEPEPAVVNTLTVQPQPVQPTATTTQPDVTPEAVASDGEVWFAIVECSRSEALASEAMQKYIRKGYDSAGIMHSAGGTYRIFVSYFTDRREAANYVRALRKSNPKLASTWLMSVEVASLPSYNIKNKYNDNQLSLELSHPNSRTERDQG